MNFSLLWLPKVLIGAGLTVQLEAGWEKRGHGDMAKVRGVLCHHTAGPLVGDAPSLHTVIEGRADLAGPLSQLFLSRSGVWHVVAAGKAWHAGAGNWKGITAGNSELIGVEAENTGTAADHWPDVQTASYAHGVAAILDHIGAPATMCAGHKEYATPPGRKTDPNFDMDKFRAQVSGFMGHRG